MPKSKTKFVATPKIEIINVRSEWKQDDSKVLVSKPYWTAYCAEIMDLSSLASPVCGHRHKKEKRALRCIGRVRRVWENLKAGKAPSPYQPKHEAGRLFKKMMKEKESTTSGGVDVKVKNQVCS